MIVLLVILAVALVGMTVGGVICYRRLAIPNMLPLAEQDLELCREIVARGEAAPWICRRALKTGLCPCQPCERLERIRAANAGDRPAVRGQGVSRAEDLDPWVESLR